MNGHISTELKPRPGRSVGEELAARLALLDGKDRFSLLLWRLPDDVPFDRFDLELGPDEYIQCAGGDLGRFTCEVRRVDAEGNVQHNVIGRNVGDGIPPSKTTVSWSGNESSIYENEALSLADVEVLFSSYLTSDSIPAEYGTRVLDF